LARYPTACISFISLSSRWRQPCCGAVTMDPLAWSSPHASTCLAAPVLGVSQSTVRRWIRDAEVMQLAPMGGSDAQAACDPQGPGDNPVAGHRRGHSGPIGHPDSLRASVLGHAPTRSHGATAEPPECRHAQDEAADRPQGKDEGDAAVLPGSSHLHGCHGVGVEHGLPLTKLSAKEIWAKSPLRCDGAGQAARGVDRSSRADMFSLTSP
jgi:hypothetical protein